VQQDVVYEFSIVEFFQRALADPLLAQYFSRGLIPYDPLDRCDEFNKVAIVEFLRHACCVLVSSVVRRLVFPFFDTMHVCMCAIVLGC
jgi:hypothetical protein